MQAIRNRPIAHANMKVETVVNKKTVIISGME